MKMEQSVPKRQHIKFSAREMAQKKEYNIRNTRNFEIKKSEDICYFFILEILLKSK